MSISPERVIELQQNYMQRLAGLWTDFFREPEKMAEPIKDARFRTRLAELLASFYARATCEFGVHDRQASVEVDRKQAPREIRRCRSGRGRIAVELPRDQPEGAADLARDRR
jgi:hypothetical protein